jgi:SAM-dependent methyltransferase
VKIDYTYHYRKWGSDTPEGRAAAVQFYTRLYGEHFSSDKNACILDVGCGSGRLLDALQSLGYKSASGIDIDPGQVDACHKKGLNVTLVEDSRAYLETHPQTFDQILAFDLIEHIPHDHQLEFVAAIVNALKPGGSIVCTVPNANSWVGMRYRYIDWTHHESFTEHSLDFLLYSGGFRNIRVLPAEKPPRPESIFKIRGVLFYLAWKFARQWQRFNYMVELGPEAGRAIPLSANLLGLANRP